ncbi:MAG: histidine kinase [Cyclobacteriaceae bacterium]
MVQHKVFSKGQFSIFNMLMLIAMFLFVWIRSIYQGAPAEHVVFWPGAYFISILILSPAILYMFSSFDFRSSRRFFFIYTATGLFFGLIHFVLTGGFILLLERLFGFAEHYTLFTLEQYASDSWYYIIDGILWYWGYVTIFQLFRVKNQLNSERKKKADMQQDLIVSDLTSLSTELNPHFLFNSMNSIAMNVRLGENKTAVAMIASLNDLLRSVLSMKKVRTIPLAEELNLLEKYLLIEKVRFGGRVTITQDFDESLLIAKVPQLILQPLVENAFKHGIKENETRQQINISGTLEESNLTLTVFNTTLNQNLLNKSQPDGIGLSNTISRLRKIYGTKFRFQRVLEARGIAFKITIPFEVQ